MFRSAAEAIIGAGVNTCLLFTMRPMRINIGADVSSIIQTKVDIFILDVEGKKMSIIRQFKMLAFEKFSLDGIEIFDDFFL